MQIAVLALTACSWSPTPLLHPRPTRPRAAVIDAKIIGAALAAAFTSKSEPGESASISIADKEERVIVAIREGLDAGFGEPRRAWSALGAFGQASGDLAQTWLTPQQLERCAFFWGGGGTVLARDLRRGRVEWSDLRASPWFGLLALNTFPWTPLLLPLVSRAVNSTDGSRGFVPRSFSAARLDALQRLQREPGLVSSDADADAESRTPQNIDEGLRFFVDGGRMLLRDARHGRLLAYGDSAGVRTCTCTCTSTLAHARAHTHKHTCIHVGMHAARGRRPPNAGLRVVTMATYTTTLRQVYGWFALLSLSTFPLTPLLLPLIDKRRPDGTSQRDYVPTAFRARRLAAFARFRASRAAPPRSAVDTLREAAAEAAQRPPPAELLAAIVALPGAAEGRAGYLDSLAGGGAPGRRWTLRYIAGKEAVKEARQAKRPEAAPSSPAWLGGVADAVLPWRRLRHGLYVDAWVSAVQRFDLATWENENGVYELLGAAACERAAARRYLGPAAPRHDGPSVQSALERAPLPAPTEAPRRPPPSKEPRLASARQWTPRAGRAQIHEALCLCTQVPTGCA